MPAQINVGYGTPGFFINDSGLVSTNEEWLGWLGEYALPTYDRCMLFPVDPAMLIDTVPAHTACDWSHGVPQLFWQYFFNTPTLPCSCAIVELCAILV